MSSTDGRWPTRRLRYLADFNPPVSVTVRRSGSDFPLYPMDAIHEFGEPSRPEQRQVGDLLTGYSYLEPTDVGYAKVTPCFENGKGVLGSALEGPSFATSELTVLRPRSAMNQHFLAYVLQSDTFRAPAIASMTGAGGLRRVSEAAMRDHLIPTPPLSVQRATVDYLDHETAEIDEFIAEQEQLLRLFDERIESTWSREFTRACSMSTRRAGLKQLTTSLVDGPFGSSLTSSHYTDEGATVVRLGNIGRYRFKPNPPAFISYGYATSLSQHDVAPGDVVIAGLGDARNPVGRAAVIPETFDGGIVKADCYRARPNSLVTPSFLAWALSSPQTLSQQRASSQGSTRIRLNLDLVGRARIPLPDTSDQVAMVERFDQMLSGHALADADINRAITLARERRAALITAAVTGQIDVTQKRRTAAEQLEEDLTR